MGNEQSTKKPKIFEVFNCRDEKILNEQVAHVLSTGPLGLSHMAALLAVSNHTHTAENMINALRYHSMVEIDAKYGGQINGFSRTADYSKGTYVTHKKGIYKARVENKAIYTPEAANKWYQEPPSAKGSTKWEYISPRGPSLPDFLGNAPRPGRIFMYATDHHTTMDATCPIVDDILFHDNNEFIVLHVERSDPDQEAATKHTNRVSDMKEKLTQLKKTNLKHEIEEMEKRVEKTEAENYYAVFFCTSEYLPRDWTISAQNPSAFEKFRATNGFERNLRYTHDDYYSIDEGKQWFRLNLPCHPTFLLCYVDVVSPERAICPTTIKKEMREGKEEKISENASSNMKAWRNVCLGHFLKWWIRSRWAGRYLVINLTLQDNTRAVHSVHANALLCDKKTLKCTRVESHGNNPLYDGRTDDALRQFLKSQTLHDDGKFLDYETTTSDARAPLFTIQNRNSLCASWACYAVLTALRVQVEKKRNGRTIDITTSVRTAYGYVVMDPILLLRFLLFYYAVKDLPHYPTRTLHDGSVRMEGFVHKHLPDDFSLGLPKVQLKLEIPKKIKKYPQKFKWMHVNAIMNEHVEKEEKRLKTEKANKEKEEVDRSLLGGGEEEESCLAGFRTVNKGSSSIVGGISRSWWVPSVEKQDAFNILLLAMESINLRPFTLKNKFVASNEQLIALLLNDRDENSLPLIGTQLYNIPLSDLLTDETPFANFTLIHELIKHFIKFYAQNTTVDDFIPKEVKEYPPFKKMVQNDKKCILQRQAQELENKSGQERVGLEEKHRAELEALKMSPFWFNQVETEWFPYELSEENNNKTSLEDVDVDNYIKYSEEGKKHTRGVYDIYLRYRLYKGSHFCQNIFEEKNVFDHFTLPVPKGHRYKYYNIHHCIEMLPFTEAVRKHLNGLLFVSRAQLESKCERSTYFRRFTTWVDMVKRIVAGTDAKGNRVYPTFTEEETLKFLKTHLEEIPKLPGEEREMCVPKHSNQSLAERFLIELDEQADGEESKFYNIVYDSNAQPVKNAKERINKLEKFPNKERFLDLLSVDQFPVSAREGVLGTHRLDHTLWGSVTETDALHILKRLGRQLVSKEGKLLKILVGQMCHRAEMLGGGEKLENIKQHILDTEKKTGVRQLEFRRNYNNLVRSSM